MNDIIETDSKFKQAIGEFIIAFSELEYGLAFLCTMTDFDLRHRDHYLLKYMGMSFDQKQKCLTKFINEHLSEVKPVWDVLKEEIGNLNRERRFLVHGIMMYVIPKESITTHIRENGKMVTKKLTIKEIKSLTNRLHHVNTGENGVNGEFHTFFTKSRVNQWNRLVNDDAKIEYKVNGKVLSDWKRPQ